MSDLSTEEGARRYFTQHLNWLQQMDSATPADPDDLAAPNGDPNDDPNWDPNAPTVGIDVSDAVFGVWRVGTPGDGTKVDGVFWALWNGKEVWSRVPWSADKLTGLVAVFESDEIKLQGMNRIYFERLDGNAGAVTFEIGERK